ncbi:MAG: LEA type 2 family protein [Rhodocyclaceae bacterium]|nr:LEA type 2 family protein [Rhodocyclaceae bacterium]
MSGKRLAALAALAVGAVGCTSLPVDLRAPEVGLADVRYLGGTVFEHRFEFELRMVNPNGQALEVEGSRFTIDLNGKQFARGISDRPFTIPAHAERLVRLPAVATLNRLIGQIANPGAAQGLSYAVEGHLEVGGYGTLPFAGAGRVGAPPAPVERF